VIIERRSFVVLGDRVGRLRRRLGPTAWAALEELLARSSGTAERCEAVTSTRALAVDLGLSKDTVARALVKLRRAGIVTGLQRRSKSGTFTIGSYLIDVPDCIVLDRPTDDGRDATATPPNHPVPTHRATRPNGSQLALTLDS
jgi:DNA-binding transcriptional ArsR family regulator